MFMLRVIKVFRKISKNRKHEFRELYIMYVRIAMCVRTYDNMLMLLLPQDKHRT